MSVSHLILERRGIQNGEKQQTWNEPRPAVRFGPREGEVRQSQTGEGGLHAVGQSPGAAVPREPRAQVAEKLETQRSK